MIYDLTVIIPVYNEQGSILQLLDKLTLAVALKPYALQYIIVDDGCIDNTPALLRASRFAKDGRFVWLNHKQNLGKGSAIRTAIKAAAGAYTVIQDGDLEYDPNDIAKLLDYARKHNSRVVYGSRNLNPQTPRGGFLFYWGGRILTLLANALYSQKLTDEPTCYKLFLTDFLKNLPLTCTGFEFCPEVTALAAKEGVKIQELSISYAPRDRQHGKKIRWTDWFAAAWTLVRLKIDVKKDWITVSLLFIFIFLWYLTTWQHLFMGYERETAQSAVDLFSGTYQVFRAGIGAILMYLPFVALGKLFTGGRLMDFLTIVPIFYSALTSVVLYFLARRLTGKKSTALLFAILTATASLMWPYSRIGMEYQAMLALAVLLWSLLRWKDKINNPIFVGVALAFLALVKSYGLVFAFPALIFIVIELRQIGQTRQLFKPKFLAALFGPLMLVIVSGVWLNYIILGKASGAYNLAQEFQVWNWWEGFFGVFFSAGKSILFYSPLLIIALWYWKNFLQKNKSAAQFVAASFLLLLLLTSPFSFWSDETLSVRKLMPVLPLMHLPLVYALEKANWSKFKKIVFGLLIAASLYAQFINSLYPYWYQLVMFRPYNLDTLSAIRYSPRLSALALNHKLLLSYLHRLSTGQSESFSYQERFWMRCCTGPPAGDPFLVRMNIDLAGFDRPEIYLVKGENKAQKKAVFVTEGTGLILIGLLLAANIYNKRKAELAD